MNTLKWYMMQIVNFWNLKDQPSAQRKMFYLYGNSYVLWQRINQKMDTQFEYKISLTLPEEDGEW